MIEHVFDSAATVLDPEWLEAAMSELKDRWRAHAEADEPTRRLETQAARAAAEFEVGALHLSTVRSTSTAIGSYEAARARSIAAFCRSRPASLDRQPGEVGAASAATRAARPEALTAVSEWAVDELAVALSMSQAAASRLAVDSLQLVHRLPGTLAALQRGQLSWDHVRVLTELVAPLPDDVRTQAEDRLLSRLGSKTPPQLRAAARRVVARLDVEAAARRVQEALADRRVGVHPTGDGLGDLTVSGLPLPVARALHDALQRYADAAEAPGDERTRSQRMVDCLVDLVLRPGEHGLAPVQVLLTVIATVDTLRGADDEPGEVNGDLVPADMVRALARALGLMPAPAGAEAPTAAEATTIDTAPDTAPGTTLDTTLDTAPDTAAAARGLADLLGVRSIAGTALAARPHVALADALTGQLLALTDAAGLRAGRPLGPPPETPGYRPGAELDRFVRLRDRRCRFPGCRQRPIRCDLDHEVPWPLGPTAHDNLCCLCRHHHRLSHQAPGWRLRGRDDGGLEWTTPTGQVLTTYPPRHGADDDLPPPTPPPPAAPSAPDDDPPPF